MGIIQRQGLKHAIVSYGGVALGILSTIFIYPKATELYGLFNLIFGGAVLCISFFMLGFNIHSVKFFPVFQNEKNGHNGFLGFLLTGISVGFILFLILLPLIKYFLLDILFKENENRELFASYFYFIVPIVFLLSFNTIFLRYISNFHRIVIPNILDQFLIKITLPSLCLLYLGGFISINNFLIGIVINYLIVFIGLIIYTKWLGQFHLKTNFKFITKPLAKNLQENSLFGLLNSLGSQIAFRIDTIMVMAMLNISTGGVYAIVNVISDVITKPYKAISAIASPIISKSLNVNDMEEIKTIYQKSSITLLIIGWFIFLGIWGSIDDLILIMGKETIRPAKYVVLFLGLAKIVDLATSVNSEIIYYSKKFQFNFYALMFLAVLNVILNLIFIPKYGITGAALATFCSISIFNLAKLFFIWFQFSLQPFSFSTLKILLIAGISWGLIYMLPLDFHPFINIMLRSICLTIIYGGLTLFFNVSPDVNGMVKMGWEKVLKIFKIQ
ncbi:MAG: lipopolysaccharide biosynthesis protein [Saprospiraceae bacterium]